MSGKRFEKSFYIGFEKLFYRECPVNDLKNRFTWDLKIVYRECPIILKHENKRQAESVCI